MAASSPGVTIVHAIPGRLRLRIPALHRQPALADRIIAAGMAHPGVHRVRVNLTCASVVVECDPSTVSDLTRNGLFQRWLTSPSSNVVRSATSHIGTRETARRLVPLGLAIAGTALSFVGGGLARVLAFAATAVGALPIVRRAVASLLRKRQLGVDHLDTAAVGIMLALGDVRGAALVSALVALGEEIRERTASRSRLAALDLHEALGRFAWLARGTERIRTAVDQLQVDDVVVVYPGDLIPVDGVVVDGESAVDQKVLTGESKVIAKAANDRVFAGTVVLDGKLAVRAEAVGRATRAGWIVQALEQAPAHDTRAMQYANRFADRLVGPTFVIAGLVAAATGSLARAAAVLIVDFATGIRVSAPTTVLATLTRAAREGILIKGGRALEKLAAADAIVFDKTGTLTCGDPAVHAVVSLDTRIPLETVLGLAAAADMRLGHPVARVVVQYAQQLQVPIPRRERLQYASGLGVQARVQGRSVRVGSARFMEAAGLLVSGAGIHAPRADAQGLSCVYVAIDETLAGALYYHDPPRAESAAVLEWLRAHGVKKILMVSGDEPSAANAIARQLGIGLVHAAALPEVKAAIVRELQQQGHVVAVVGDGLNDSAAFALADVSVSMPHGAEIARETADVVLMEPNLWKLANAITLARQCAGLIRQNLLIVAVPNATALTLASVGGLGPLGATLLNNGSTVFAALNSLRPLTVDGASNGRANGRMHTFPRYSVP